MITVQIVKSLWFGELPLTVTLHFLESLNFGEFNDFGAVILCM